MCSHYSMGFTCFNLLTSHRKRYDVSTVTIPILHMEKLSLREVKQLAQDHAASNGEDNI